MSIRETLLAIVFLVGLIVLVVVSLEWLGGLEPIDEAEQERRWIQSDLDRIRTPQGWLVIYQNRRVCYVHDPEHERELGGE